MPNAIKYNVSTETLALKKENFWIGTGDVGKGSTPSTGFYNGVTPPSSGYTVYTYNNSLPGNLSYFTAETDSSLISQTNSLFGTSYTSATECLVYYAGQTDKMVFNIDYPPIITNGILVNIDAGFLPSYPTSGVTWYDISGKGNNDTLINGPTLNSFGGGSILFDGVDDSSTISGSISGLTGITINIWFYSNISTSSALIKTTNSSTVLLHFRGAGFYLMDSSFTGSGYLGWTAPSPTGQNWRMLTGTWDGTTMRLYQNGVKQSGELLFTGTGILRTISSIDVGSYFNAPQPWTNGYISNFQIYNRALSNTEILQNYQAMLPRFVGGNIVTSGLVGYWDAGYATSYPTTGTSWFNVAGTSGGTATLTNGPTYSANGGGCLVFDGVDDYCSILTPINAGSSNTVCAFIKLNGSQTSASGAGLTGGTIYCPSSNAYDNYIGISGDKVYLFATESSDINNFGLLGTTSLDTSNSVWYFITSVIDGNTASIYINGNLEATVTKSFIIGGWNGTSYIGVRTPNQRILNGSIGNISVYNRALTQSEISQNYNAQKGRFGL